MSAITLYEIASQIKQQGPSGKVAKDAVSITHGLHRQKIKATEGLAVLSPGELATIRVPRLELNENGRSSIVGYQRKNQDAHVRRIMRHLKAGGEVPVLELSIDNRGAVTVTDGQHRALAAIGAGVSLKVVITKRSAEEASRLFSDQRNAIRPNPALAILSGNDSYDLYIQDAVTSSDHPWSDLIGMEPFPAHRMGPQTAKLLLAAYVGNVLSSSSGKVRISDVSGHFDKDLADHAAQLVRCFGTKDSNPTAFKPRSLRAISVTMTLAVRRSGNPASDAKRWTNWMPQFPFSAYAHITSSIGLTDLLVGHWNKRLKADRRISRGRS